MDKNKGIPYPEEHVYFHSGEFVVIEIFDLTARFIVSGAAIAIEMEIINKGNFQLQRRTVSVILLICYPFIGHDESKKSSSGNNSCHK